MNPFIPTFNILILTETKSQEMGKGTDGVSSLNRIFISLEVPLSAILPVEP